MLLLVNNLHEKRITESQNGRNFSKQARAICTRATTLRSCYNVALMLHEKCTHFQPIRRL